MCSQLSLRENSTENSVKSPNICPKTKISVYKNSNIHGYFITYPWIFHYVTADISLNIRGYLSFCVRGNWKLREELLNFREVCWSFPKGVIPTEHSDEGSLRDFRYAQNDIPLPKPTDLWTFANREHLKNTHFIGDLSTSAAPCQAKNKTFLLGGWRVISTNCFLCKGLSCLLP